jgi:very-short-patch-repair endonuclease
LILPGTGRGTSEAGGGGSSLHKPEVYAARKLRRAMSPPEAMLWQQLRGSRLGVKVRRQHPIGPYVVDFYVRAWGLVVEVDGEAHNRGDRPARDEARDAFLSLNDYRVLHVPAVDVINNLEGVLQSISARAHNPLHHVAHGPPPRAGEDF